MGNHYEMYFLLIILLSFFVEAKRTLKMTNQFAMNGFVKKFVGKIKSLHHARILAKIWTCKNIKYHFVHWSSNGNFYLQDLRLQGRTRGYIIWNPRVRTFYCTNR